jgi:hypothetical protein
MNEQIDWSKAPEGTTHASAMGGAVQWYKSDGFGVVSLLMQKHPAAATWNGPEDGLPPVGMTVRIPQNKEHHEYVERFAGREVLIVAHAADRNAVEGRVAVFQCKMDDGFNEYHGLTADRGNFEPVRTAEQRAAEERERKVESALKTVNQNTQVPGDVVRHAVEAMIDAGYVKP